jgi:dipeptide transport system ATP-binding protein
MNAPLLEAKDLTRHYIVSRGIMKPKGIVRALDGVSFRLAEKKTLAVVGESGCGKSTLARQITMIEAPTGGELWLNGVNLVEKSARKRARSWVQMVFQNPYASLNPRKKIGTMLEEPLLLNTALERAERIARAQAMLAKVGLRPEHYHRYPHMFSGGQRQRIAIARALMVEPKVVVADEPVSALDVSVQGQVLNLLADLQEDTGVAYLFISHNLAVVEHIADDVLVMYFGKVVERGSKRAIFSRPAHPYTRALLASAPVLDARTRPERTILKGELPSPLNPPSGCPFHSRCPYAIERCRIEAPQLRVVVEHEAACHRLEEIV